MTWLASAVAAPAPEVPPEILVVDAGTGSTVVVLPAAAGSCAQFAAIELQDHLEKITGVRPPVAPEPEVPAAPVRIAVGATALGRSLGFPVDQLEPWEFLVAARDGVIVLAGGDQPGTTPASRDSLELVFNGKPNGTCRAVYEFLEQLCGVHWYLPSEAGMVYPKTPRLTVRLPTPIRRRTDFRSTSLYPYQVNANMFCPPDTPELTGEGVPDSDTDKWRLNFWTIPVTTKDMLPVAEVIRWLLRNKVGGESYGPNHSFGNWLPRFGREHPDWFSYKDKARVEAILAKGVQPAFNEFHTSGEPCLTAPGVFEQVLADARDFQDRRLGRGDPTRKDVVYQGSQGRFFGIVPNDNYVWCQCPGCKARLDQPVVDCPLWGGASGRGSAYVWEFINRVARDLRQTHPDGWVAGIAYHDYMPPPAGFTLEPNVAVTICTYLGNWTPALRQTAYGLIHAWRDQAKCQWLGLWEYFCYCAMSQYQPMFPKVCPRLLGNDVRQLHQMGVVAEFIETEDYYRFKDAPDRGWAVWTNPIWLYLNVWIRFKLWDDTSRDVDRLLTEHYRLFYGPAAVPIQRFFERIEARVTDMSLRGPKTFSDLSTNRQTVDFEYLFPPPVMAELRSTVDEAVLLATAEPFRTRVGWVNRGFLEPQEQALTRYQKQRQATAANRPREAVCYRLSPAPTIDGDGSDPAWQALPPFYLGNWRTAARPKVPTWFRLGYDDANLYALVRCDDPAANALRATCHERDGDVYQDDCVELHLALDADKARRVQVLVNSLGVIEDFQHTLNEAGMDVTDRAWTAAGILAAAKVDATGYTVEIALPWNSLAGRPADGASLYGNVCREKYTGGDGAAPDELQAWCPTQGAFADAKHFGRILLVPEDGWRLFFSQQSSLPAPVLYKVDAQNPWILAPDCIQALPERDLTRYHMNCPQVAATGGRIYGGFGVKLDPPVDVGQFPVVEAVFRKANREVMLELVYNYTDADGKPASNYFILSPYGDGQAPSQVFVGSFADGHEKGKPGPRLLTHITVYGVVEGAKTPTEADYQLQWLRVCRHPLRQP